MGELLTHGFAIDACIINPTPGGFRPRFYTSFLDLSKLLLSFETALWRREFICSNFCSREYGCNNMYCSPLNAAKLL